ncbi:MAG TPA: lipoyl(octanoyl) transferase LipB [Dehalococcoidia bacterium]|nr:lipoyl(octanoyl) transferase LipB [Dehalococcoidia bacterium]
MLCYVYQLGQVAYREAYRLQTDLLSRRINGDIGDTLLLLEHPPTITVGKSGRVENILVSPAELAEKGIPLFFVDRGGDVTYHGPGQLVGYPIIDLKNRGKDLHQYVHNLEEAVIRTLGDFGIRGGRDRSHRGVWVKRREIAAIGLRVSKWVTVHGFALNIDADLAPFSLINPCGFSDRGATSMAEVLGREIAMTAVTERLMARFAEVFQVRLETGSDNLARAVVNNKGRDTLTRCSAYESQATVLV